MCDCIDLWLYWLDNLLERCLRMCVHFDLQYEPCANVLIKERSKLKMWKKNYWDLILPQIVLCHKTCEDVTSATHCLCYLVLWPVSCSPWTKYGFAFPTQSSWPKSSLKVTFDESSFNTKRRQFNMCLHPEMTHNCKFTPYIIFQINIGKKRFRYFFTIDDRD